MTDTALNILLIGAHPDDCELLAGGYAARMTKRGHQVRLLSMTDGSRGHYALAPQELIPIRRAEAQAAADLIGAESEVLSYRDGQLMPELETREYLIRYIRTYAPDLIITHRPNDYHPDHRYTSLLVQDSAFLLGVPGICPETPVPARTPHILFFQDRFLKPPFQPDIVISIDETFETRMAMVAQHASQVFDWLAWLDGNLDEIPESDEDRLRWLRGTYDGDRKTDVMDREDRRGAKGRNDLAKRYRSQLVARYGEAGQDVQFCEAFEISEYGAPVDEAALARLFPDL